MKFRFCWLSTWWMCVRFSSFLFVLCFGMRSLAWALAWGKGVPTRQRKGDTKAPATTLGETRRPPTQLEENRRDPNRQSAESKLNTPTSPGEIHTVHLRGCGILFDGLGLSPPNEVPLRILLLEVACSSGWWRLQICGNM